MFKKFDLPMLFDISTTKSVDKNKLDFVDDGEYDFIGRTSVNWGIQGRLHKLAFEPNPKDSFSLIQVGETVALWRERNWYASQNLFLLNPKLDGIKENKLYFQSVINKEMSRYGKEYNSYPTMKSLSITKIVLPVIENPDPNHEYTVEDIDWKYMRNFIIKKEQEVIEEKKQLDEKEIAAYYEVTGLKDCKLNDEDKAVLCMSDEKYIEAFVGDVIWKKVRIGDMFDKCDLKRIKKTFNKAEDVSKEKTEEYSIPLVNAKHGNNGIMYYGRKKDWETTTFAIDIVNDGAISTGDVYPQPQETGVLYNAYLIKCKEEITDEKILLFLAPTIEKVIKDKFSYDNKASWEKVKEEEVELPFTTTGELHKTYIYIYVRAIEKTVIKELIGWKNRQLKILREIA